MVLGAASEGSAAFACLEGRDDEPAFGLRSLGFRERDIVGELAAEALYCDRRRSWAAERGEEPGEDASGEDIMGVWEW